MRGELIGESSERGIFRQRVDGSRAKIIDLVKTAISAANGIYKCWTEGVGLFQADDLAPGGRVHQYRVEAIGRAIRRDIAQVGTGKVVLARNLVITPDC